MRFGMPVLVDRPRLDDCLALCESLGLDFVEINMNLPEYAQLSKQLPAHAWGKITLHMDERFDPWHYHPDIAAAHIKTLQETQQWASKNNVPKVTLHMNEGVYFTLPEGRVYLQQRYRDTFLRQTETMLQAIQTGEVLVCIENTGGWTPVQREGLEMLLSAPQCALTWDVGHDSGAGHADTVFLETHQIRIAHMHLHDTAFKQSHLPLGTGEDDLHTPIAFAQTHDVDTVIEVKTPEGLRQSVAWLEKQGVI